MTTAVQKELGQDFKFKWSDDEVNPLKVAAAAAAIE